MPPGTRRFDQAWPEDFLNFDKKGRRRRCAAFFSAAATQALLRLPCLPGAGGLSSSTCFAGFLPGRRTAPLPAASSRSALFPDGPRLSRSQVPENFLLLPLFWAKPSVWSGRRHLLARRTAPDPSCGRKPLAAKGEHLMAIFSLGIFLVVLGLLVSVLFWVPAIVDRPRLKSLLGPRYPLLFVIYLANGPALLLLGLLLFFRFRP
jgi:hypothetical protein